MMEKMGFVDQYRTLFPDPVSHRGSTWSPLKQDEPRVRIDRLYYKSNRDKPQLKLVDVKRYPERLDDPSLPIEKSMFSSDHYALLFEFEWQ
jgi:hypothetical protein